jgi:citrate lyase subunit beta/citryl-CoA lyase
MSIRPLRSILFIPGNRCDLISKVTAAGPDAIVLDLEDAVATNAKGDARRQVAATLRARAGQLTFVRLNHPSRGQLSEDIEALAPHSSQAIMLPKVESAAEVLAIDKALSAFEEARGLAPYAVSVMVGIESSLGLRNLFESLRSTPRARGAVLASAEEGDFMVDIGGQWTPTGEALSYARGKFVCDARAARCAWIFDGAFMNLADGDALTREARLARTHGCSGKIAIHPRQVPTINQVFSPTALEISRARKILEAFCAAEAAGRGAIQVDGMMVDYANVRLAEQVLTLAGER